MCEITNPNVPAGCMGPIRFPSDGVPGSGDIIVPRKPKKPRKKRLYRQKSSHKIMNFDEFVSVKKEN